MTTLEPRELDEVDLPASDVFRSLDNIGDAAVAPVGFVELVTVELPSSFRLDSKVDRLSSSPETCPQKAFSQRQDGHSPSLAGSPLLVCLAWPRKRPCGLGLACLLPLMLSAFSQECRKDYASKTLSTPL